MKNTDEMNRFRDPESILIVVNKKLPWPVKDDPKHLVVVPGILHYVGIWKLREEAAAALEAMDAAAKRDKIILSMRSGYRNTSFQAEIYAYNIKTQGQETTDLYCSRPFHSEHHTGLAVDFGTEDPDFDLIEEFKDTPQSDWLRAHAHEFGFILRYPRGKVAITGYSYEPWHYRYIGTEEAGKFRACGEGMTMEEFYGLPGGTYEDQ